MASLNEFLAVRHRALVRALAETRHRLSSIEEEIEQIERAAEAANISLEISEVGRRSKAIAFSSQSKLPQTMKEAAVEALKDEASGMTTNDILKVVNDKLGTNYPRSSLSPQLSRLKGDGILYREGDRWILAPDRNLAANSPSLNENGASEDAPDPTDRE
ncbi:winged helix-turn-helix domain-containing protein [Mesorhizobium sp. B283B1A]|uniref:winged helix-turn-helix domain-containing protein n=1 Tax=Mesorhizobium TaxID=68287 RepID=UPI001CD0778F|nr:MULTISPECIES: winged helix-turn-helix domain-containing protein [Mesorhizobium]MCA0051639.1 winged helix-turn-helix domain-containing protein [Mesorhizobium sp. B283B1A]UQS67152.1 winged helix-turn-helix domain-containing protein [Mesorhizobium opportunistum]